MDRVLIKHTLICGQKLSRSRSSALALPNGNHFRFKSELLLTLSDQMTSAGPQTRKGFHSFKSNDLNRSSDTERLSLFQVKWPQQVLKHGKAFTLSSQMTSTGPQTHPGVAYRSVTQHTTRLRSVSFFCPPIKQLTAFYTVCPLWSWPDPSEQSPLTPRAVVVWRPVGIRWERGTSFVAASPAC